MINIFVLIVDCKKKLCGSLDGLFQIYQRAVIGEGPFKVSAEDSLHLVEALRYDCFSGCYTTACCGCKAFNCLIIFICSMVITELPSEHAKKALEAICLPAVAPLQVCNLLT